MQTARSFKTWIEEHVATLAPGASLPTDRELAAKWSLSSRSVRRVMSCLKREGRVVRVPGKGTFVAGVGREPTAVPPAPRESGDRLAGHLADAISRGEIRRGDPLPQTKYLCLQYRVSERTVMNAYRRLERTGIVSKIGRRYWVGGFSPSAGRPMTRDAFLFAQDPAQFPLVYSGSASAVAFQKLERELRACGVFLRCALTDKLPELTAQWTRRADYPVGLVFWNLQWDDYGTRLQPYLTQLVEHGPRARVPVLLDLVGPSTLRHVPPRLQAISHGNLTTNQARAVASFVARIARPEVVLLVDGSRIRVSPRTGFLRYQKMVHAIEQYPGTGYKVRQVVVSRDPWVTPARLARELLGADKGYLAYLREKYGQGADLSASLEVVSDVADVGADSRSRALWLCSSDALAAAALGYLNKRGIGVPARVSILTFENTPEYLHLGLSACAPDWDLAGYLMAHAILGDFPLRRTGRGFIRVDCQVVQRLTTPALR